MGYATPPDSTGKGMFSGTRRKPVYYEDVYGKSDAENEEIEGLAEECETESDSEDEDAATGKPSQTKRSSTSETKAKPSKRARDSVASEGLVSPEQTESEDEPVTKKYRIAPKLNSKTSVPADTPRKTLLVKKSGIFGSSTSVGSSKGKDKNMPQAVISPDTDDEDDDSDASVPEDTPRKTLLVKKFGMFGSSPLPVRSPNTKNKKLLKAVLTLGIETEEDEEDEFNASVLEDTLKTKLMAKKFGMFEYSPSPAGLQRTSKKVPKDVAELDEDEESLDHRDRSSQTGRRGRKKTQVGEGIRRAAGRQPIQQQLKAREKAKKEASRTAKAQSGITGNGRKGKAVVSKAAKRAQISRAGAKDGLVVVIDNSGIDAREYEYISDGTGES